jgi:hypothetical protein
MVGRLASLGIDDAWEHDTTRMEGEPVWRKNISFGGASFTPEVFARVVFGDFSVE